MGPFPATEPGPLQVQARGPDFMLQNSIDQRGRVQANRVNRFHARIVSFFSISDQRCHARQKCRRVCAQTRVKQNNFEHVAQ